MLSSFYHSKTSKEYSLANVSLSKIQLRLLFKTLEFNTSLRDISLTRKDLVDDDIEDLFEAL